MVDGNSSIHGGNNSAGFGLQKSSATLQRNQETIYKFLLQTVQERSAEKGMLEFQHLFFSLESNNVSLKAFNSLKEIISFNNETIFHETLKRCCYILINNWEANRSYAYIRELVNSLNDLRHVRNSVSRPLTRMRGWISSFVKNPDYQELKLFAARHDENEEKHWSSRYTSFLLVPQYADVNNPIEQREAAQALSQQLKNRFKFDLAMYTARSESAIPRAEVPQNPTALGDGVLRLVKKIVIQINSHKQYNVGRLFLKQTENLQYNDFKLALKRYLIFSINNDSSMMVFSEKITDKLGELFVDKEEEIMDEFLLLRTCNRLIDYLTTENRKDPSSLFILFLSQGNTITLVILLLKVVSISPNSRIHLEERIAKLIQYYMTQPVEDSAWVINFFEVFKITSAIYADSVEYNLVKIKANSPDSLDAYRLFSQLKGYEHEIEEKPETEEWDLVDD